MTRGNANLMPKTLFYEDVKVVKKPIKKRLKAILKFFLFVVVVVGCFCGAGLMSRVLTVGNISSLVVFGDTRLKIKKSSLFAVTLGFYETRIDAEKVALGANIQGAGGYVWEDDGFAVVGNVYSSEADAESVITNLKDTKYKVDIKVIEFPELNLNFDMYDNSDMDIIRKSINIFDNSYARLYDYSIRYDKGEISHLAVSSGISEVRGEVKGSIVQIQNLINKSSSCLSIVQTSLIKLDEILDQAIIKTIDNSSTNHSLKYAITDIVRVKYDLFQQLK